MKSITKSLPQARPPQNLQERKIEQKIKTIGKHHR